MNDELSTLTGRLPAIVQGQETRWVAEHLGDLCSDDVVASPRFRGTQAAADAALHAFDVKGYANNRNEVFPKNRRGGSALSPWIRHGMLPLPHVWQTVDGPFRDVEKFRDELRWAEYARHLYARVGTESRKPFKGSIPLFEADRPGGEPWDTSMLCMHTTITELETDGWLANQTRMWLASQWSVRHQQPWLEGEDYFFRHLLDGSRAANRLGWQWVGGTATGKPYGFSRWQVNKRAPGLCSDCPHKHNCPIEDWPPTMLFESSGESGGYPAKGSAIDIAGPSEPVVTEAPTLVWITAESLGDGDPALQANPELPVLFIFDEPLLQRLRLSSKRLVFLAERLSELAQTRELHTVRGTPEDALAGRAFAATFTPVPGWQRITQQHAPVAIYPWPWLHRPKYEPTASFSAWRNAMDKRRSRS